MTPTPLFLFGGWLVREDRAQRLSGIAVVPAGASNARYSSHRCEAFGIVTRQRHGPAESFGATYAADSTVAARKGVGEHLTIAVQACHRVVHLLQFVPIVPFFSNLFFRSATLDRSEQPNEDQPE